MTKSTKMVDNASEFRAAALQTARSQGCDCQPDITAKIVAAQLRVSIAHDDDCALMQSAWGNTRTVLDVESGAAIVEPGGAGRPWPT